MARSPIRGARLYLGQGERTVKFEVRVFRDEYGFGACTKVRKLKLTNKGRGGWGLLESCVFKQKNPRAAIGKSLARAGAGIVRRRGAFARYK